MLKDFDVAAFARVLFNLLRAKLKIQVNSRRYALALVQSVLQHFGIHVHVSHLAARARAAICGVDTHFFR